MDANKHHPWDYQYLLGAIPSVIITLHDLLYQRSPLHVAYHLFGNVGSGPPQQLVLSGWIKAQLVQCCHVKKDATTPFLHHIHIFYFVLLKNLITLLMLMALFPWG